MTINYSFWNRRRVLITGHTGFKGSWLTIWLKRLGADVTGIALPTSTSPNLFELAQVAKGIQSNMCDICDVVKIGKLIKTAKPEVIFHLAAQPLVRASYRDPIKTFTTNIMGTAHVLESLRGESEAKVAVVVTTDKVYRDQKKYYPYCEEDELGGHDPYSASKAASEIVIGSYRDAYLSEQGLAVASARAGNVIGGGDWSEDRLIPDAVRAWNSGRQLVIRNLLATRPWQHVLEPLAGYLMLAQKLWEQPELAGAYNFGPLSYEACTVERVVKLANAAYGAGSIRHDSFCESPHETVFLALEVAKARKVLNFNPRWRLAETIQHTMGWYKAQHQGGDASNLCEADISAYEALA